MRTLTFLLLAAAVAAAAASPLALGAASSRRALLAPACKTWTADVIVTFKDPHMGAGVIGVIGGQPYVDLANFATGYALKTVAPPCIPATGFKPYTMASSAFVGRKKQPFGFTLKGTGLKSQPAAAGECADVAGAVVSNLRFGGAKVAGAGAAARVCLPCAGGAARNVTTGNCIAPSACDANPCGRGNTCSVANGTVVCTGPCYPSPCKANEACAVGPDSGKPICLPM